MKLSCFSTAALAFFSFALFANAEVERDIEYGNADGISLKLNLFKPQGKQAGRVVYVHGGGWRGGAKEDCSILSLVSAGYAVASVDYRLIPSLLTLWTITLKTVVRDQMPEVSKPFASG